MKKQIRRSVFETNSSSMHSLSIIGSDMMNSVFQDTRVAYGEFGWGYEELTTSEEKLSYLVTEYKNEDHMIELIKSAFKNHTGCNLSIESDDNSYWGNGYIDHQSQGMIREYVTDEQSIIDIVFNDKYTIIIDNDNH